MAAQIRIGASGFSYKEWLGAFYPPKLPGSKMLAYYAERLPTVEINYTFRAMPRRAMLERWAEQTPAHFRFADSIRSCRRCVSGGNGRTASRYWKSRCFPVISSAGSMRPNCSESWNLPV